MSLVGKWSDLWPEAGCDEAGRGCFAGPVFAAAVIWPPDLIHPKINDSKQLNKKNREELRTYIEKNALAFSVSKIEAHEIDKINILWASVKAMQQAIVLLSIKPKMLLIDGNRFKKMEGYEHTCIVKGDGKSISIAAASILAKTYRDDYMENIHLAYPQYGWNKNKGYGTQFHRDAITKFGVTPEHRKSFANLNLHPSLFKNK